MARCSLDRLIVFGIGTLAVVASAAAAHADPDAFFEQLDVQIEGGLPEDDPGAVFAVARAGEVLCRGAWGKASLELDVDLTFEHSFRITSATTPITASAVMALVEDDTLRVRDAVAELHPRIIVEHLLSHTSGLPDLFDLDGHGEAAQHEAITPEVPCAAANGVELLFEPGTQHRYSNLGYALRGKVIEAASGQSLFSLQDRIFARVDMDRAMCDGDRLIVPGAVTNSTKAEPDDWRRAEPLNCIWGHGLGGLFSTVEGVVSFGTALRGVAILEPETVERMQRAYELPDGSAAPHGLGWSITKRRSTQFVHHGGGIDGCRAYIVAEAEQDVFVVELSNRGEERTPVASIAMMVAAQVATME